jgi:flavin reductase (DIM6/NTAB) family NADH-FMN oxidoreductase RutF
LLLVSVRDPSPWLHAVLRHQRFAVNVLASEHEALARWCSDHLRRTQPAQVHDYGTEISQASGLLVVPGALAVAECHLYAAHRAGDHVLVVGEVDAIEVSEHPAAPLVFFDRVLAPL